MAKSHLRGFPLFYLKPTLAAFYLCLDTKNNLLCGVFQIITLHFCAIIMLRYYLVYKAFWAT